MIAFLPEKLLVHSCCLLLLLWYYHELLGNGSDNSSLKTTAASPSSFLFPRNLVHVEGLPIQRNQKSPLHHHNYHQRRQHQQQKQSVLSTKRIGTSISATQKNIEGFAIPLVTVSRDRFRFRNLTRSIEYSVVYDHRDQNEGIEDSSDGGEQYAKSIDVDTNDCDSSSLADRFPLSADHHLFGSPANIDVDVRRKDTPAVVGNITETLEPVFGNDDECNSSAATVAPRPRRHRASTARLANPSMIRYLVARAYGWLVRKLSPLGRLFLFIFGMRIERYTEGATATASTKGFSEADIGGTKRHYTLLVASVLSGGGGLVGAGCGTSVGVGMLGAPGFDPLSYHHAIVRSAHHRTVASLSSSTLSKRTEGLSGPRWIDEACHALPVTALQRHARRWLWHQRRTQQNQQGRSGKRTDGKQCHE